MNVQQFDFSMLILVLDMAIRSAFSKDAISKLEDFVFTRDNVQGIIIDLFQHPAEYLHLRRARARAIFVIPPEANLQFFPPHLSISFVTYTTTLQLGNARCTRREAHEARHS